MADWRIVTPTREPEDEELGPSGAGRAIALSRKIFSGNSANDTYEISYYESENAIRVLSASNSLYYLFQDGFWTENLTDKEAADITGVDLTIPNDAVNSAEIYPYFYVIAFEEGTTACKLAVTNEAKTLIRNALINKGVDVPDTTPFRQYAGKVGEIGGNDIPESVGVKIQNIAPNEYDIYYFSNISGDGTTIAHLTYDDLVSFTILGGTPVAIKGYSWSAPMIWDNFHAKEITAMPINAPGADEVYYVVDSSVLFDDENGSISLEINSQSG